YNNLQALNGDLVVAHTAGHAHALKDVLRVAGTDGTRGAVVVRTVGLGAGGEVVALDGTGKAFTLGNARYLYVVTSNEGRDVDSGADLEGHGLGGCGFKSFGVRVAGLYVFNADLTHAAGIAA